jgi:hypothetical protein
MAPAPTLLTSIRNNLRYLTNFLNYITASRGRQSSMADSEGTTKMHHLDPHERPPTCIRDVYKKYQKIKLKELDQDQDIINLSSDASASSNSKVHVVRKYAAQDLTATFRAFAGEDETIEDLDLPVSIPVYEHDDMPGKTLPMHLAS